MKSGTLQPTVPKQSLIQVLEGASAPGKEDVEPDGGGEYGNIFFRVSYRQELHSIGTHESRNHFCQVPLQVKKHIERDVQ